MKNLLISIVLFTCNITFGQNYTSIYGGINYGLRKGVRDYLNHYNLNNNKLMPSVNVIIEQSICEIDDFITSAEGNFNYLSFTKSNSYLLNYQLEIFKFGADFILKKPYSPNIYYGIGLGYNIFLFDQTITYSLNKKQKAKTDGFEVIILSDLVASNDEDNTFSLLVSPRLRFNFAKILKISSPFPTLLAQNLEVNLNNFSIELNFGIRF